MILAIACAPPPSHHVPTPTPTLDPVLEIEPPPQKFDVLSYGKDPSGWTWRIIRDRDDGPCYLLYGGGLDYIDSVPGSWSIAMAEKPCP